MPILWCSQSDDLYRNKLAQIWLYSLYDFIFSKRILLYSRLPSVNFIMKIWQQQFLLEVWKILGLFFHEKIFCILGWNCVFFSSKFWEKEENGCPRLSPHNVHASWKWCHSTQKLVIRSRIVTNISFNIWVERWMDMTNKFKFSSIALAWNFFH